MTPLPVSEAIPSARSRCTTAAHQHHSSTDGIRTPKIVQKRALFGFVLPLMLFVGQAMAATYTVTNLKDSGPGSLRAAMLSANASKGSTVNFATTGTINLSSSLPVITSQMTVDGTTAPGFSVNPVVSVNFNSMPGITVAAGADL